MRTETQALRCRSIQTDVATRSPRVFITGDTHGDIDIGKLSTKAWKEQKSLSRDDILIVAGDFGVPWTYGEDKTDKYILKWYSEKPYTIVFVDGNHDNEDALKEEYSVVRFLGAKCHMLRENVFHVMRGEVLHAGGHKILCMGGAKSTDIERRTPHISWWADEEASYKEWEHCFSSLESEKPDIIVSHDAPETVVQKMIPEYSKYFMESSTQKNFDMLLDDMIQNGSCVKDWFFGHHHIDRELELGGIRYHAMYQKIKEL